MDLTWQDYALLGVLLLNLIAAGQRLCSGENKESTARKMTETQLIASGRLNKLEDLEAYIEARMELGKDG